jgi:hypothetical protein
MYIRDLRVVQGGVVPVATFTPLASAPFSYASPGYVANMGTTVFTLLGQFVTYVPGKYNQALRLMNTTATPSQNYLQYTYPTAFDTFTGMTICFWMKMSKLPGTNAFIFQGNRWYALVDGAGKVEFVMINNSGTYRATNLQAVLVVDTWYHFAYTSINGVVSAYINGSLGVTRSDASTQGVSSETSLGIASTAPGVDASFDDLRIYNTALTAAQVQSVYSSQGAPAPSRAMPLPKLAWDFNGTTTEYMINRAISLRSGWTPTYGTGKYNRSLIFTNQAGVNPPVTDFSCTFPWSVNISQGFTVAFWVKINVVNNTYIIHMGNTGTGWGININDGGSHYINENGTYPYNSQNYNFVIGQWCHVLLSIGSAVSWYKNGAILGSPIPYVASTASVLQNRFWIGSDEYYGFNGEIDDLRIFDRALTSAQVQAIYNQQGVPGRGVQTKSPIQPGYIYELNNNTTNFGTPSVAIINASNPDPRIYMGGDTGRIAQWDTVPNLLTLWDTTPFKYYMIFLVDGYTYPLYISTAGTYSFDFLFIGPGGNTDSFFLSIDSEADAAVGGYSTAFTWITPVSKTLTVGYHTIKITAREPSGLAAIRVRPNGGPGPTLTAFRQNFTGTPLFTQLSPSATSSAVGAFSLRAVNGTSAKAVNVAPGGTFPPSPFTSASIQNVNQYTQTLSGYPFSGSYVANTSTVFNSTLVGWKAFSQQYAVNQVWASTAGGYSSTSPYQYIGGVTTTDTLTNPYSGEWIQLQSPSPVILTSYSITNGADYGATVGQSPKNWWVLGSSTGLNGSWTLLDTRTGITWAGTLTQTQTFTPSTQTASYLYFRVIVNQVSGYNVGVVQLSGVRFFGTVPSLAQDFYADRLGNLLTAPVTGQSLARWLGGATGYVRTWYDQSGQGQHMNQSTAANQPIISLATSPPSILFTGNGTTSGQYFQNTIPFTFNFGTNYQYSIRAVVNNTVGGVLVYKGKQGAPWSGIGEKAWYLGPSNYTSAAGNYPDLIGWDEGWVITSTPITSSKTSVTWASSSFSSVAVYENASSVTPTYNRSRQYSDASNYLYFGITTASGVPYYNGNIYEIEIFSTPLGASDVTIMG